jgi:hypothetical protein
MTATIHDTYFFLLEQPAYRRLDLCAYAIEYQSASFSQDVYERARGKTFGSRDDAYRDWLDAGRAEGLPYAEGKNTYLKIVLKVKDEPELIVKWIEYHARIVGYHNLVVMNCGSVDPAFLDILQAYRDRVLILDYDQYYDNLSFPGANVALYSLLARNCKYLSILDADEFLFGHLDGTIAPGHAAAIVRDGTQDLYAGTWVTNALPPRDKPEGGIDFGHPIAFSLDPASLRDGTFAGKSVMRASLVFQTNYLGHNLHLRETIARMDAGSFGKLLVFHLAVLSPALARARVLKHLHAKGIVPPAMPLADVEAFLVERRARGDVDAGALIYIDRFMQAGEGVDAAGVPVMTSGLLADAAGAPELQPALAPALAAVDFAGLVRESFEKCAIALR